MVARIIGPAARSRRVCLDFVAAFTLVSTWIASLRAGYQDHICLTGEAAAAFTGHGARDDDG
jgi:hypothetical protein